MLLLTPGPTPIPERVQKALMRPMRSHLDPEVLGVNRAIQEKLFQLFDPGPGALVAALAGSGSLGMEAGLANLDRGPVLVLVNGAFSQRVAEMAQVHGLEPRVLEFSPGEPVDPEAVARALKERPYRMVAWCTGRPPRGSLTRPGRSGPWPRRPGPSSFWMPSPPWGCFPSPCGRWGWTMPSREARSAFPPPLA